MAGDWIKIRTDLFEDPAVMKLSDILGTDDPTTVGLLVRFWSWADKQTTDGTDIAITSARLDRLIGREGFAEGMRQIGWLSGRDGSLCLPRFQRHNGSSAKARALEAEAKRLRRASSEPMSDNTSDTGPTNHVPDVRPEKRRREENREEKNRTHQNKERDLSVPAHTYPSREEVETFAFASPVGITHDCALKFWNDHEAVGWLHKGQAIRNWRPLLENFARSWNRNEQQRAEEREFTPRPRRRRELKADDVCL